MARTPQEIEQEKNKRKNEQMQKLLRAEQQKKTSKPKVSQQKKIEQKQPRRDTIPVLRQNTSVLQPSDLTGWNTARAVTPDQVEQLPQLPTISSWINGLDQKNTHALSQRGVADNSPEKSAWIAEYLSKVPELKSAYQNVSNSLQTIPVLQPMNSYARDAEISRGELNKLFKQSEQADAKIAELGKIPNGKRQGYAKQEIAKAKNERSDIHDNANIASYSNKRANTMLNIQKTPGLEDALSAFRNSVRQTGDIDTSIPEGVELANARVAARNEILQKYNLDIDRFNEMYADYDEAKTIEENQATEQKAMEFGQEHPVAATGVGLALSPVTALSGLGSQVEGWQNPRPMSEYSDIFLPNILQSGMRSGAAENIDSELGQFAYGAGNSIADVVLNGLIAKGAGSAAVGGALTGARVSGDSMQDALSRGASNKQAAATGLASGAAEGIGETLSLGSILKPTTATGFKNVAKNLGKSALVEGSEEGVTNIVNAAFDSMINGQNSAFNTNVANYRAQGMSEDAAVKQASSDYFKQLLTDMAAGGIAGGALGGINMAMSGSKLRNKVPVLESVQHQTKGNTANAVTKANIQLSKNAANEEFELKTYSNSNGIDNYTNQEISNLSSEKGMVNGVDDYRTFIQNSVSNSDSSNAGSKKKRYYFGKVSEELATDIKKNTGYDVIGRNIAVREDELRHALNEHPEVTIEDLEILPSVFNAPDSIIKTSKTDYAGRNAIEFTKRIDGVIATVTGVADGRNSLEIDTVYFKKINPNRTANGASTPNQTPETGTAQGLFDNSIPNSTQNVNTTMNESVDSDNAEMTIPVTQEQGHYSNQIVKQNNAPIIPNVPDNQMTSPNREMKISKTRTNTMPGTGFMSEFEMTNNSPEELFMYEPDTEVESVMDGLNEIEEKGADRVEFELENKEKGSFSGRDIDKAMSLWDNAVHHAQQADAAGMDSTELWNKANKLFKMVQVQSTDNARAIQALAKWSRRTPVGMLAEAERIVNGKASAEPKGKTAKSIQDLLKKYFPKGGVEFSDDFQKKFLEIAQQIQQNGDMDSPINKELMARLGKLVNSQIPSNLPERAITLLMDNMLGNIRTLITRNAGGNVAFNVMEQLKKPIAAGIDTTISKKTGVRTTSGLTRNGLIEYVKGMGAGLIDEARDIKTGLHTARSGENTLETAIRNNRHVFKANNDITNPAMKVIANNPVTKVASFLADKADSLVHNGLSIGDRPFYEATYRQTLSEYNQMRNKGKMGDVLQNLSDEEFKTFSESAAKINALAAVYQDDTALAQGLIKIRNGLGDMSRGIVGADILSQFSMPFVKTPANLVTRAIEYSPFGGVKNAVLTAKELKSKDGLDQSRFANETARNILGTGLYAGALGLASLGNLSGGYSEDKDMKNAQKNAGMQEYALTNGNNYMDVGWIPVLGNNLVSAAAAYDATKNNPQSSLLDNVASGTKAGLKSLLDQSVFQGMQRMFGGNESYSNEDGLVGNVLDTIKSGASQLIPSLSGQAAGVLDDYERYLSGPEGDEYYSKSLLNKIPVVRQENLMPKVNTEGELVLQNQGRPIGNKILENMILPGKITEKVNSPVNDEAMRLYEKADVEVNKKGFLPTASWNDFKDKGYDATEQEYFNYQKKYGMLNSDVAEKVINSDFYDGLSDNDKALVLGDIYEVNKQIALSEIIPNYEVKTNEKAVEIYKQSGIDGLVEYQKDRMSAQKLDLTYSTYKKKQSEYSGGAEQYAADKQSAIDMGFVDKEGNANLDAYQKAQNAFGGDSRYIQQYANLDSKAQAQYGKSFSGAKLEQKIPMLEGMNISNAEKGKYLAAASGDMGKKATAVYNQYGPEGYYLYYLGKSNKDDMDYNGNGKVTKDERESYFRQMGLANEMAAFLAKQGF